MSAQFSNPNTWIERTGTSGVSKEARFVEDQSLWQRNHALSSIALGSARKRLLDELFDLNEECRNKGWDGYSADPITIETYRKVYAFIGSLPAGLLATSIGAEPDGSVTLEWHKNSRHTLSVSIAPAGEIHYAALIGLSKSFGTAPFYGEVPEIVLTLAQSAMSQL